MERAGSPLGSWSIHMDGHQNQNIPKLSGLKRMVIAERREKRKSGFFFCVILMFGLPSLS